MHTYFIVHRGIDARTRHLTDFPHHSNNSVFSRNEKAGGTEDSTSVYAISFFSPLTLPIVTLFSNAHFFFISRDDLTTLPTADTAADTLLQPFCLTADVSGPCSLANGILLLLHTSAISISTSSPEKFADLLRLTVEFFLL
jgi:hypothetical protein